MRVLIAIGIACVAMSCTSTHRSVLPPYVRDLRPVPGGLQMDQCELVVTTTKEQGFNHQLGNSKTERLISDGQCWNQTVSTEPPAGEP